MLDAIKNSIVYISTLYSTCRLANSENMFSYYINTVQIMDMFRKAIVTLRTETRNIILLEMIKVDQEYAVGIFILIILFIISPLMVFLVRNAVNALQVTYIATYINIC